MLYPNYFGSLASSLLQDLRGEIHFPAVRPIILNGVNVAEPRDVVFHGQAGTSALQYGILRRRPLAMTPVLTFILDELFPLVARAGHHSQLPHLPQPNCVLINHYKHGQDSMGFHSDNYVEMGQVPFILSLSLGAVRLFRFVSRRTKEKLNCKLISGSVLVMIGREVQQNWLHGVPKTSTCSLERWNLSYRYHISRNEADAISLLK